VARSPYTEHPASWQLFDRVGCPNPGETNPSPGLATPKTLFGNLLSHAIELSYPDSTIAVTGTRQSDETTIRLADQGIGIPPAMMANLFDLEAKTTRTGTNGEPGTGFGLRTVKQFVDLFGGQMENHLARRKGAPGRSRHDRRDSPKKRGCLTASLSSLAFLE
jgi:hypothetical protein